VPSIDSDHLETKTKDVLLADLVGKILTNGKAGLMDLNLVKNKNY
jgi:hypothetical protein